MLYQDDFWLMNKLKSPSSIKHRCYVENAIERRTIKTVEIDQVNSRFVLLLRWMEIIFAKRRMLAYLLLFWFEYMKTWREREHAHIISTIRVNFEWTKHIRQMKPKSLKNLQEEDFAQFNLTLVQLKVSKFKINLIKTLELSLSWRNRIEHLLILKKTWYASMMENKRYSRTIHHW